MPVLILSGDLMASSKLQAAAQRSSHPAQFCLSEAALVQAAEEIAGAIVVIDLATSKLDIGPLVARLRALPTPPAAILAFGPHVQEQKLQQATAAGCDGVYARGEMHARCEQILAQYR